MSTQLIVLGWAQVQRPEHSTNHHLVVHPIGSPSTRLACGSRAMVSGSVQRAMPNRFCHSCCSWLERAIPLSKAMWGPTPEQLEALWAYKAWAEQSPAEGKLRGAWKHQLMLDWQRAGSSWPEAMERWHLLQQLRNQYGPSWLTGVSAPTREAPPR